MEHPLKEPLLDKDEVNAEDRSQQSRIAPVSVEENAVSPPGQVLPRGFAGDGFASPQQQQQQQQQQVPVHPLAPPPSSAGVPPSVSPATFHSGPSRAAVVGGNDDPDTPNTGNLINESYANLSQMQWLILFTSVFYVSSIRVLVHLGMLQHSMHHVATGNYQFIALLTDLIRLVACLLLEAYETQGDLLTSLYVNFRSNSKDALKPAIPVLLGILLQFCLFRAIVSLPLALAELGIIGTPLGVAFLSMYILNYSYTQKQWICLCAAVFGLFLASDHHSYGEHSYDFFSVFTGIVWVFGSVMAGSLFVVYFEKILKQDFALQRADPPSASLWMRVIQYSLYSGLLNLLQGGWQAGDQAVDPLTWFFTPTMALGLLINVAVLKFATSVHDKLALLLGFAISRILSWLIFDYEVTFTWMLYMGSITIIISVWLFGCPVPAWCRLREEYYQRLSMNAGEETSVSRGVSFAPPPSSV